MLAGNAERARTDGDEVPAGRDGAEEVLRRLDAALAGWPTLHAPGNVSTVRSPSRAPVWSHTATAIFVPPKSSPSTTGDGIDFS